MAKRETFRVRFGDNLHEVPLTVDEHETGYTLATVAELACAEYCYDMDDDEPETVHVWSSVDKEWQTFRVEVAREVRFYAWEVPDGEA